MRDNVEAVFDDPKAGRGAREVLASIDRMLAILRAPPAAT